MNLGIENRKQTIAAAVLGALLLLVLVWEFMPSSSTIASTAPPATAPEESTTPPPSASRSTGHHNAVPVKKERPAQSLDPTLNLRQLTYSEQIKYEGSGRNIFISQADPVIPVAMGTGATDVKKEPIYTPPAPAAAPPIPLKFFGFASKPGEPKKIFLSKGEDVFIAGEGEIIDRRYKIVKISTTSVEIQDVVNSGPPQSIPLTQG